MRASAGKGIGSARVVARAGLRYNPAQTWDTARQEPGGQDIGGQVTRTLRIGIGHDTHRLEPGGPLRLGGVDVPASVRAVGHSDADVLLHAITDAVLGAAAWGDIGELFPDDDPANRGRDSGEMLHLAWQQVSERGFRIVNLDCIVFLQEPKLSAHKDRMCQRIASLLGLPAECVGLKAKTGESVGPIGRKEAVAAQCVVLLESVGGKTKAEQ